ncbi:hypothetical protein [Kitasatospora purpeofusca]|uniref:hypothetical protein n=1 Tax=Kitasatospora purpeofusca TaxID=67352 RepID=UPI0036D264F6
MRTGVTGRHQGLPAPHRPRPAGHPAGRGQSLGPLSPRPAATEEIHLIYRTHVTPDVPATLATREFDELPGGGHEVGSIEWIDHRKVSDLPLFPPIGKVLAQLPSPHAPLPTFEPEPVTDRNYTWI